jgi:D-aminoacyl-tRNA deacylase
MAFGQRRSLVKALVQRVSFAEVCVDGAVAGSIGAGVLILLGVRDSDTPAVAQKLAAKVLALRIFEDPDGRMNLALDPATGAVLCVSQFTLYADVRRGNRPSFAQAAAGETARPLYDAFCAAIEAGGVRCERGVFGAHMQVRLENDGPVTVLIDSDELEMPRRG